MNFKNYKGKSKPYKRCFITSELRPEITGQYILERDNTWVIKLAFILCLPIIIYALTWTSIEHYIYIFYIFFICILVLLFYKIKNKNNNRSTKVPINIIIARSILYPITISFIIPYNGLIIKSYSSAFILKTVILAPIFEEMVFRILPVLLLRKYKYAIIILILINIYFSLIHFTISNFNLLNFFQHLFFGASLTFIYLDLKKPHYPIIIHSIFNLVGLFLL